MASEKEKSISPETESEPEVSASEKTVPAEINHRHHRPHYRSSDDQKKTIRFRKRKAFQLKTEPVPAEKLPEEKPEEKKDLPAEEAKPAEEVKPEILEEGLQTLEEFKKLTSAFEARKLTR